MRSKNVYRTIVSSFWFAALDRETVSVVIPASRHYFHSAEWVLPSSARIACNATPCLRCHRPSRDSQSTSAALSTDVSIEGCEDPSAIRRTTPDSWHRAERRSHGFRPLLPDRRLPHPGIRNCREVAPRESPPTLSFPTSSQNAGSRWGRP